MWLCAGYMWAKGAALCTLAVRMRTRCTAVRCAAYSFTKVHAMCFRRRSVNDLLGGRRDLGRNAQATPAQCPIRMRRPTYLCAAVRQVEEHVACI